MNDNLSKLKQAIQQLEKGVRKSIKRNLPLQVEAHRAFRQILIEHLSLAEDNLSEDKRNYIFMHSVQAADDLIKYHLAEEIDLSHSYQDNLARLRQHLAVADKTDFLAEEVSQPELPNMDLVSSVEVLDEEMESRDILVTDALTVN